MVRTWYIHGTYMVVLHGKDGADDAFRTLLEVYRSFWSLKDALGAFRTLKEPCTWFVHGTCMFMPHVKDGAYDAFRTHLEVYRRFWSVVEARGA